MKLECVNIYYTYVLNGKRYLVKFVANGEGFQPIINETVASDQDVTSDELRDFSPLVPGHK